ncbi:MAG: hypothetical protein R3F59_28935 [Myxococcota bacterium]
MRTLSDRCVGPSLEAFARDHALPYHLPEPGDATLGLPEAAVVEPATLHEALRPVDPLVESAEVLEDDDQGDADEEGSVWVPGSLLAHSFGDEDDVLLAPPTTQPPAPPRAAPLPDAEWEPIESGPVAQVAPVAPSRGVFSLVVGAGFGAAALAAFAGLALGIAVGLLLAG